MVGTKKRKGKPLLIAAVGVATMSFVQSTVSAAPDAPTQESTVSQHPVGNLRPPPPPPPDGGTKKP